MGRGFPCKARKAEGSRGVQGAQSALHSPLSGSVSSATGRINLRGNLLRQPLVYEPRPETARTAGMSEATSDIATSP